MDGMLTKLCNELSQKRILLLATELLVRKAGKKGLRLTQGQKSSFGRWLKRGKPEAFSLRFPGKSHVGKVEIAISARDVRRLVGKIGAQLERDAQKAAVAAIDFAVLHLRKKFGKTWPAHNRYLARLTAGFRARLLKRYETGFELLAMLLTLSRDVGDQVNTEVRPRKRRGASFTYVDVLTRLHARACQIADEVTVLLRAGYADGAMARWRSLHEVSIVMLFIAQHGPETAVRYSDHEAVESWKAALGYNDMAARLSFEPFTPAEMARLEHDKVTIAAKYEKGYGTDYGWAALAAKKKEPTFADIEKAVGLDHFRPFYKFASHNVHAGPKGAFYRLSVLGDRKLLPTGSTNVGLTDPAQNIALSITQATATVVQIAPYSLDRLCIVGVMNALVPEIANAFWQAEQKIQSEEAEIKKGQ
jgi:hypothetical protein